MVIEAGVAAGGAEATVTEAAEVTVTESVAESSVSGATELSETLKAFEKEVPREVIADRATEARLQDPTNQRLEVHSKTGVLIENTQMEINGELRDVKLADFSEHSRFEFQLRPDQYKLSDYQHGEIGKEKLQAAYENGQLNIEQFTDRQLEQIANGDKPEGLDLHHDVEPGRMQFVDAKIHAATGHTGGRAIWGGGSEAR